MATVTSVYFQNHCFLCLEQCTPPKHPPAAHGSDNTSKVVNIQPLLRYLAGADPIASNPGDLLNKKIPLLNNADLPPLCTSCNGMLLELQRFHQSLLQIQLLIQTETVKMRKVIESASSTKVSALPYTSSFAKFCGVIESSQMPVGVKQGIVQLVKDFRETVIAEGASSVKFPSSVSISTVQPIPIQVPLNVPLQFLMPVRLVQTPVPIQPKIISDARTNKRKQKLDVKIVDVDEPKPQTSPDVDMLEDDTEPPEVEVDVKVKSEESDTEDDLVSNDPLSDGNNDDDDDDDDYKLEVRSEPVTARKKKTALQRREFCFSKGFMPCFVCPHPKPDPFRLSKINDHIKEHLGRDGWTCPSCGKIFPTRSYLNYHLNIRPMGQCRTNKEKGKLNLEQLLEFTCSLCPDLQFNNESDFFKHVTEIHEQDPSLEKSPLHMCKICQLQFRTEDGLQFHFNSHISTKSLKCSYVSKFVFPKKKSIEKIICHSCGKMFPKESLSYHLKTAHPSDDLVKCVLCEVELKEERICEDREDYFQHLMRDHKGCPKPCHVCWTSEEKKLEQFGRLYQLRDHLLVAHKIGQEFLCEFCNDEKSFHTEKMLREHVNIYHRDKSDMVPCDLCLKSGDTQFAYLQSEESLKNHMEKVHPRNKFKCERCPSSSEPSNFFRCKFDLTEHEKESHKDEPLVCSISSCLKLFDHQLDFKVHVTYHQSLVVKKSLPENQKNFVKCPHCDKGFPSRSALKKHEPAHSKETPFICAVCGKGYRSREGLKGHEKTHQYAPGEKPRPHVCEYCSRAFTERGLLVQHTRIHTGERPYTCDICGDRFRQSVALRTHLISHKKGNFRRRGTFERGSKRRPLEN